ncbi:hypothetical protein P280DRAFT_513134 [Massarina eburnea CBS 473.64]|uniref:Uncharacterized protein n=1 Tax=Massarina eburnea CBS 473.64 TaxID=1395130 RepID=A0A6A6SBR8_9PLEO|nr:hypothetical protein P280DRAFT_513134 [Massarina eburnea CBS 473.64]
MSAASNLDGDGLAASCAILAKTFTGISELLRLRDLAAVPEISKELSDTKSRVGNLEKKLDEAYALIGKLSAAELSNVERPAEEAKAKKREQAVKHNRRALQHNEYNKDYYMRREGHFSMDVAVFVNADTGEPIPGFPKTVYDLQVLEDAKLEELLVAIGEWDNVGCSELFIHLGRCIGVYD